MSRKLSMTTKHNPIHIAHVLHSFSTGGLENGVVNIINNLPKGKYQHSIICVTDHDVDFFNRIKISGIAIYNLNKPAGKGIKWLWHCFKLLKQLNPDICHTRNLSALEAQVPAFFAGIKYRIHGEHGWDISDVGGTNVKYQKLRRFFKPFIHQYIALSCEAKQYLIDKIKVNKIKINHICNGVDIVKFSPNNGCVIENESFIGKNDIVFGTVGRLAEIKNQTFLVNAFIQLVQNNLSYKDQLKLIIVGDGVLLPSLKALISAAELYENVWFTGNRDDVNVLMNRMNVFVLPSLAEGVSNTLLEAMASGLPCIATNVGGNADLICAEHKNSHIINVNDIVALTMAMQRYINDSETMSQDSQLVRLHCENNFSIDAMVGKYNDLYQLVENKE